MQKALSVDTSVNLSFVIPAYNEEKLLPIMLSAIREQIESVSYEIIVVDNGSGDSTAEIAYRFGARVLVDSKRTIAGLRNLGASVATGTVLVFLDADVILTKEWAENVHSVFVSIHKNNQIITGSRYGIRDNASWIEKYWFLPMTEEKANYMNGGNLIIDRRVFYEIGCFDEALTTGEDFEFSMRAKEKGIEVINNPGLRVVHEGYPRTLRQFIKREKWHGIQDVHNIESFLKSWPAMLGALYWVSGTTGLIFSAFHKTGVYVIVTFIINSIFCIIATLNKRRQFRLNVAYYFVLYHVYFFARGLPLIEKILQEIKRVSLGR